MSKSSFRPVALVVTLLTGGLVAWLLVWPQGLGAQTALVYSQAIAFRGMLAVGLGVGALVAAAIAARRRTWAIAAGCAIVLGIAAAADGAILVARGTDARSEAAGQLTVVAWNTQGGSVSASTIAGFIADVDAEIVSLPEMGEELAGEIERLLDARGLPMAAHTTYGPTGDAEVPTSLLVADSLGEYRMDAAAGSTPVVPSAAWQPVDGAGPTIVAAHPYPPLPWAMDHWRAGLRWVAAQCDDPDVIVAGDLNATVDHLSGSGVSGALVGGCRDAALSAGAGAIGTWPSSVPPWFAAPIDHVLVGAAWTVDGFEVGTALDGSGSDHRPVIAVVSRR